MRWLRDTFTVPGVIVIGLLIGGSLLFFWFLWAIEQARADEVEPRAVTSSYGPDISHCFAPEETRELWDCIRHEEKEDGTAGNNRREEVNR